ncbi:MAG: hypothetical protein AAF986_04730, partial [Pseudomonadota bacterium]
DYPADNQTEDGLIPSFPSSRMILRATKWVVGGLAGAWIVGWPLGTSISHVISTGTLAIRFGYSFEMFMLALLSAILVGCGGVALAGGMRLEETARRFTKAFGGLANDTLFPQGTAARQQVGALNKEIDQALGRLAEAESLIRQQVRAIDSAGAAIETGAVKSTERLEKEREALMKLAEEMNQEAERFADKIAERTNVAAQEQGAIEQRIDDKERELDSQMKRLEAVSAKSLNRFEQLASAMEGRSEDLQSANSEATERQTAIASQLEENTKRIENAHAELAAQSQRIESLIKDQRARADRLAKLVTQTTQRAAPVTNQEAAPTEHESETGSHRKRVPWRDILATVEEALPVKSSEAAPAKTTAQANMAPSSVAQPDPTPDAMDRLINRLHNFSLVMRTQLFDGPSHEELDRFEQGERQVFSRDLIARDSAALKELITSEVAHNEVFKQRVDEFLRDFDTLLEPLSTEDGGEEAIESYLASPIGRLYVLTGSAVNHFA